MVEPFKEAISLILKVKEEYDNLVELDNSIKKYNLTYSLILEKLESSLQLFHKTYSYDLLEHHYLSFAILAAIHFCKRSSTAS